MEQLEHAESKWNINFQDEDDRVREVEEKNRLLQQQYWALE